ncbi:MATE family efflux transporter [Ferviditalea candida]|uniref:Probable multidrug resistance protein NorM n=1 Tax=Ferviditalea candida TaxID=3108399 RepID=A0ABU5ZLB9_9BACL|nr:MATE family efflux transporter [Paenibacillaceae bacterium T2]
MLKSWKKILFLGLPSVLSFAAMTVTGTINLIMVGHLGAIAIAIVGVSNIIMYNVWALFSGIGQTVNYLVAQSYGANDMDRGVKRIQLALVMGLGVAVFAFAAGATVSERILSLISGSDRMAAAGEDYLRLRFYAMAFGIFNFVFHGFFRGVGDTRTPALLSLAGSLGMIFFTYVLTYGKLGFPELGLVGAGWAFFIGEALGLTGALYMYFIRMHPRFHTRVRFEFNRPEAKLIAAESGKLGMQEFAMSISMFIFTAFVGRLGANALAANEVALNVMSLGFMPAFAFSATATILVGQEVGRGEPLSGRRLGTDTAIIGSLFLLVLGTFEFFFAEPIASYYTADSQVSALAAELIKISAFMQIFDGLFNFYAGGLRGIGDTSFLLRTSLLFSLAGFVPLTYLLTFIMGLGSVGAWVSLYLYLTVLGTALMIRFYRTDWLKVKMKVSE